MNQERLKSMVLPYEREAGKGFVYAVRLLY
jgi:hypothetical protein